MLEWIQVSKASAVCYWGVKTAQIIQKKQLSKQGIQAVNPISRLQGIVCKMDGQDCLQWYSRTLKKRHLLCCLLILPSLDKAVTTTGADMNSASVDNHQLSVDMIVNADQ